ncbi:hypothetical protein [Photorhabdus noenieputensis]|uniref:hypothetical protein n=1 Tax=Photorhabdus noenieputensis TaxID=1208607 RepID=UPI001BD46A70|nr:hypothetical protein [Photorhabdus noenieputensis]MCK3670822.1 hypothetical protein [Photorhabdus noenieputensis]
MMFNNELEFSSHEMNNEELDTKVDFANPYALLARGDKFQSIIGGCYCFTQQARQYY